MLHALLTPTLESLFDHCIYKFQGSYGTADEIAKCCCPVLRGKPAVRCFAQGELENYTQGSGCFTCCLPAGWDMQRLRYGASCKS